MVTFRASARVESVDLVQLPAVACAVLDRCRRLKFDRGAAIHPSTGARIEGLSNLSNSHPRAGSEYVIVTAREVLPDMDDDELAALLAIDQSDPNAVAAEDAFREKRRETASAAGTIRTVHDVCNARITADDRKQVAVEFTVTGDRPIKAQVRIEPPQRPTRAAVEAVATVSGHWFVAGDVDLGGHIDIEALCGNQSASAATANMTARHRRGRGSIAVEVSDAGLGSWNVDVTLRARGAGWIRPMAAIIGVIARPWLQRKLNTWLKSGAPDEAMSAVRADIARIADSTPDATAAEILDDLLDGLVETLPLRPLG